MSIHKHDFFYCGLVDIRGYQFPSEPYFLGQFEITRSNEFFPSCEEALQKSATLFNYKWPHDPYQPLRFRTHFYNIDEIEIVRSAQLFLKETINLLRFELSIPVEITILNAGYYLNLTNQKIIIITPPEVFSWGCVVSIDSFATHPHTLLNRMLTSDPKNYGELGMAFIRSAHWSNLANEVDDEGEKLLMSWIACECLTRTNENEVITDKLLAALGFARSIYFQQLPKSYQEKINLIENKKIWEEIVKKRLDDYRLKRNRIVHSGFRALDLSLENNINEIIMLVKIIKLLVPRLQRLALSALEFGQKTIDELWANYSMYITKGDVDILNDLKGNVIYTLSSEN